MLWIPHDVGTARRSIDGVHHALSVLWVHGHVRLVTATVWTAAVLSDLTCLRALVEHPRAYRRGRTISPGWHVAGIQRAAEAGQLVHGRGWRRWWSAQQPGLT